MKVKFFGPLRDLLKVAEVDIEAMDIEDLINRLMEKYGEPFKEKIIEDKKVKDVILILVNGRLISDFEGMKTKLKKDDYIVIMPMTAGG